MSGTFAVPSSSSPPSTPDSRRSSRGGRNLGTSNLFPHPSTTPAGPPPSSINSFTPAGIPPPSSIFGSSQPKSGTRLFEAKKASNSTFSNRIGDKAKSSGVRKPIPPSWERSADNSLLGSTPLKPQERGRTFAVPDPSSPGGFTASLLDDDNRSECSMEDEDGYSDAAQSMLRTNGSVRFESTTQGNGLNGNPSKSAMKPSVANGPLASPGGLDVVRSEFGSSIDPTSPRSTKRLRDSTAQFDAFNQQRPSAKRLKKDSAIPGIIQNISASLGTAKLQESGHLILEMESWMGNLYRAETLPEDQEKAVEAVLPFASKGLCDLWRTSSAQAQQDVNMDDDVLIGIGPSENATPLQKASFIAPLLLQIHHPPPIVGRQAFAAPRTFRMSQPATAPGFDSSQPPTRSTPIPKVLHDWLRDYHDPYVSAVEDLQSLRPNPTRHMNYWDILFNMLLRGKVFDVAQTLKKSDFQYARTARDDDGSDGYHGAMLKNIGTVVSRMARIIDECPILRDDEWNIPGNSWSLFRKRTEQALVDLTNFVEGNNKEQAQTIPEIEAPNFGLRSTTNHLAQSVRDAERKLPSIIYENLKTMYGILLGRSPEIVSSAQDWVEATMGLTIWWDGEDDDGEDLAASLRQSRRSFRRSVSRGTRVVDLNPTAAYVRRLAAAFERVTDEEDPDLFQIDSNNSVEVGLASVFEGNVEGVVGLLYSWSLPVCSAIAEIANVAGWFESSAGPEKVAGFNQSDLMVLSYGQHEQGLTLDRILIDYADALFRVGSLKSMVRKAPVEGWERSMQILSRLDDEELGTKKVGELLQQLPLTSDKRVDKLLSLCQGFGLDREASDIAERYADHFTNETDSYGNAIIYYARAGRPKRVKHVLDLLISLSVVQSKAFPSSESLDDNLRALVENPKESLASLADLDADAAEIIHFRLAGYASLRRFYGLRDDTLNPQQSAKSGLRPMARKKAALSTLIAVINSAADNIHGGLYDPDRDSVVPVDGLLALLGEASIFLDHPTERELSLDQCIDLLKAIEDLQTVTSSVYDQCEECFRCTLMNRQPGQQKRPDAKEMLKKSISNVTSSSSAFSLIESEIMDGETRESTGSEGVMVNMVENASGAVGKRDDAQRGWDWRKGVNADASGAELLRRM
ncbi:MAG: hypothetical protein Q9184_005865, partial [Pyrenodesmia sp. 2 TL-2023]